MLALVRSKLDGCFIHVLDDASDDEHSEDKRQLCLALEIKGVVHRYERRPVQQGFCSGRELLANRFLQQSRFHVWFHLDDDILVGPTVICRAVADLGISCNNRGWLEVFNNAWLKPDNLNMEFSSVPKAGCACFAVHRETMKIIGNPYTGYTDGEKCHTDLWGKLADLKLPHLIRVKNPYACQHTGNVESVIFGRTPSWEHLFARDFKSKAVIQVPPFDHKALRAAIKSGKLEDFTRAANYQLGNRIRLPVRKTV